MKRLLYIVWQYTWGLLQNLAGGTIYAFYRLRGCPHFAYQGALAVIWPVRSGSMSLGRFLFLHESYRPGDRALLAHEYGHTIQSLIVGPLYLSSSVCPPCSGLVCPFSSGGGMTGTSPITASTPKNGQTPSAPASPGRAGTRRPVRRDAGSLQKIL